MLSIAAVNNQIVREECTNDNVGKSLHHIMKAGEEIYCNALLLKNNTIVHLVQMGQGRVHNMELACFMKIQQAGGDFAFHNCCIL
jgi:hypothetical protein